jgi:protein-tyrosine-phosphatase/predicted ATP-grasp superfamily ATP-dependent carboligase
VNDVQTMTTNPKTAGRRPKVLVLGKEDRAFLAVLRSYGRRGFEVHVCWVPPESLALFSRYVSRVHDIPAYSQENDAWKQAFIALCQRERFDLVVPTNDASIIPLQAHRAELEPHARIYFLNARAFEVCFDKGKTWELARQLGARVPRQLVLPLPAPADAIPADWYPIVLKPHSSFSLENLRQKLFVRRVRRPEDLEEQLRWFEGEAEVFVQEAFVGTGAGIEGLAADGEFLVPFMHRRIHERRKGGADSYRVSLPIRSDMLEAVSRMVKALDYTGVIMFEFKLNLDTGDWVLLEINARFWASLPLCLHAGADFPYYLYQLLAEGRRDFPQGYRMGVFCRNWGRDLIWLKENLGAPADERFPWGQVMRELWPMVRGRESSDTFVLDDPGPGLEDLRRLWRRASAKIERTGRSLLWGMPPVRQRHASRTSRALRDAEKILFVCKGNICRSPFAEAYARQAIQNGTQIVSAGYHPKENRPVPDAGLEAARELGIDLTPHRSAIVTDEMVRDAEAIFTFDQHNFVTLRERFPYARDRIHRLGLASSSGPVDIRDPYGGSVEDFRRAYGAISRALDAAFGGAGTSRIPRTRRAQRSPSSRSGTGRSRSPSR